MNTGTATTSAATTSAATTSAATQPGRAPQVLVNGLPVQLQGQGDSTVLMLHGWPDTLALWDATVAALQDRYVCARLTLPGFDIHRRGGPAPSLADVTAQLLAVINQISPERPVSLLVHDWGCLFGYELAQRHPQRVARVIGVDVGDHNAAALQRSLRPGQKMAVLGYQLWLALAWQLGGAGGPGWRRDLADRMTRAMARWLYCPSPQAHMHGGMNYPYAMAWLGTAGGLKAALPVAQLPMPMLFLYGSRKPFMFQSPRWLADLAARPGCAVVALRCGHWVMTAKPAEFHAAVRGWLDGQGAV